MNSFRSESKLDYIIPAYNASEFLMESVRSCMAQDSFNLQALGVIVVDDGSTDNSCQVLRRLQAEYANVRVFRQANGGESSAVNLGLKQSRAEFVCVLSADDVVLPNHAVLTIESLDNHPRAVAAYPDWKIIDSEGRLEKVVKVRKYSLDALWNCFECTPGPGVVIRRRLVSGNLRSGRYRFVDDYYQWLRLSLLGEMIAVPEILAGWRRHDTQQTATNSSEIQSEQLDLLALMGTLGNPGFNESRARTSLNLRQMLGGHPADLRVSDVVSVISKVKPKDLWRMFSDDPMAIPVLLAKVLLAQKSGS